MIQLGFVPEKDVMDGILKFDSFSNFYDREYMPRKETTLLKWLLDPIRCHASNLYAYQGVDSRTGDSVIGLRCLPLTHDEAFMVAHEMGHVFRKLDGLSLLILPRCSVDVLKDLVHRIGSMFEDPLIDPILQDQYMFDAAYHYSEDINRSLEILNTPFGNPQTDIDTLKYVIYYTTCLLQYDSIKDASALQKWQNYQEILKFKLKQITKSGEELYYLIKDNGYDTLEKQKRIFNKISDKYMIDGVRLGDLLYIE